MAGARSAVIQSRPAGSSSSLMRALVIIPLSPTSTTWDRPKRCFTFPICADNVAGSAVLPAKVSMATGIPSAVVSSP